MNKDKLQFLSPLFLKYQSDFEKNPRSRVFAPLAESYRKVGMTDKAMEILSQGIRFNPGYVMGYVGLAFCYFDLKQFNLAYSTLRPLVDSNRDNIRLQKLFADTCISLGNKDEALETLKYLLFINPRDKEVAKLVEVLETEIEERYKPTHKPIIIPEEKLTDSRSNTLFDVEKLESTPKIDFDDWLHIDLNQKEEKKVDLESWSVKKNEIPTSPKINFDKDNESFIKNEEIISVEITEDVTEEAPFVTHTLVDLYCGQGHIEKAIEILEKILILNPNDKKTKAKLAEIKALVAPDISYEEPVIVSAIEEKINLKLVDEVDSLIENSPISQSQSLVDLEDLENVTEEDGRRNLMSILDEKVLSNIGEIPIEVKKDESSIKRKEQVEKKLANFLQKIQQRALDYQNRF